MTGAATDVNDDPPGKFGMPGELICRVFGQTGVEGSGLGLLAQEESEQAY
jgi:hypothetical protein